MEFQRGMWAEAWVQSVAARRFVALVVFGELAIKFAIEWFEVSSIVVSEVVAVIASSLLWACLAYAVHARVLLPNYPNSAMTGTRVFGFALRSFGIGVAMAAAVLGIAIVAYVVIFILVTAFGSLLQNAANYVFLLMTAALMFAVFVRLGTLLPAYVADRVGGVDAANKRGKAQFRWIAGRLLIGPCLLFVLLGAPVWLLSTQFDADIPFWNTERVFLPVNVLIYFFALMVQAFATALTAVILSRAFLRAEGMPDTATA